MYSTFSTGGKREFVTKPTEVRQLEIAQKVRAHMFEHDQFGKMLGIQIHQVEPGFAVASVKITESMLNGVGTCHGGLTFTLADTAFAYACNSRNHKTVALNCFVNFTKTVSAGETLTATAKELSLSGKTGVYDVSVTNDSRELVALFRGTSHNMRTEVVEGV